MRTALLLLALLVLGCRHEEPSPDPSSLLAAGARVRKPERQPGPPKVLIHKQLIFKDGLKLPMTWDVTVTAAGISWTGYNSAALSYSEIDSVEVTQTYNYWGKVYCLNLPPRITDCLNTIQVSNASSQIELGKLLDVAREARRALGFWKKDHG